MRRSMCAALLLHCRAQRNNFACGIAPVDKSALVLEFSPELSFDKTKNLGEFAVPAATHPLLNS